MYGTIPTLSSDFQAEQWSTTRSALGGRRRPWKEMLSPLSFPDSFNQSLSRINANVAYFHMNYVIIVLFALFLSLLWQPVSLIIFVAVMFVWLFLYFHRDNSIVLFGYEVDERVVVTLLSILTVVLLVARATVNVVVGVSVGLAAVVVHGACRKPNEGNVDDVVGGGQPKLDLMEASSASFSSYA